ncbi:sulfite exporter TauE/SafE family protein [Halomonas sp. MCCC 1A11036]|uniref:Probable membrane transporter protein n=1 Tax=Billgrantia zhangzhouensis TaxID=2733481 RepID=A0ABS9AIB6_9GAMM|nr:sulfite exporter TauE/SafE family protein [Halomonas zhangzhouensis]MCE8021521.1 sulfite exporter TauE/SafE family protein [Halomonas zhangzhouensis]
MYLLLFLFGGLAGVTTILFGFGGGFVVVPLLYALLTAAHGADSPVGLVAMQIAVATSTGVMVIAASLATWRHHRARALEWRPLWPLAGYVAVGAIIGASAAISLRGDWVRWAFVMYLAITILDGVFRPGFLSGQNGRARAMSRGVTAGAGLLIGSVAAFLGVGGSVMTVPLLRRRGTTMVQATGLANPLTLPMALVGTATYVLLAWDRSETLGPWHAGYIDLRAFLVLVIGSWLGIRLAAPLIGRIPDRLHAKAYLVLLACALIVMVVV